MITGLSAHYLKLNDNLNPYKRFLAMKEIALNVKKRVTGKQDVKRMRKEGLIPGVYYTNGEDGIPIVSDFMSLRGIVYAASKKVINLNIEGEAAPKNCVLKDVKFHPVTDQILHFDLLGLNPGKVIKMQIPVVLKGQAVGVRKGGKVQHTLHTCKIKCLPKDLIDAIEVDISNLDLGKSIHIRDISIENIEFEVPSDTLIVACNVPRGTVIESEAAEAAGAKRE